MASLPQPPSLPPAPTTISALDDDLVREIFLRLPALPSLARAAFTCRAFLRAVRSSPAFRRRFREIHAPALLALFLTPSMCTVVTASGRGSDPDVAAAFADLLRDDDASEWCRDSEIPYSDGYVLFVNRRSGQSAAYDPHTRALDIFPKKPHDDGDDTFLEFHTLRPDGEEHRPSRVVCVHRERSWAWARAAVFSSQTMEWTLFPESRALLLGGDRYTRGTIVNGFVCWVHTGQGCVLALNTATFQFSRMDLPPTLRGPYPRFKLGQTKDGKLCVVNAHQCTLSVWLWTADHDGVEKFMLHKMFPLHNSVKEITEGSVEDNFLVQPLMVIDGFVYLSVLYCRVSQSSEWFLSFCLETAEVNFLFKRNRRFHCSVDPYIMTSWPSSLIHIKTDSKVEVAGDSVEDNGSVLTEENCLVLFTALKSFKEALIDDDEEKIVEIDSFLLDDEKNSLLRRIATLDARLETARDRVLRIGADSGIDRKKMERESWWQMCKRWLGRVCPFFFAR